MPNRKNNKKARRRNRSGNNPVSVGTSSRALLAPVTRAQLSYLWTGALLESASGIGAFQTFRMTDLYDPDFTGTGAQPVAFDQLCALYSRFRVLKTTVEFMGTQVAALTGSMMVMFPSSSSTLPSGCQAWPLQPYASYVFLGGREGSIGYTLRRTYDPAQVMGLTKGQYMDEMDFTCTGSNSPLRCPYIHVGAFTRYGTIGNLHAAVKLTFEVQCSQPVLNDLS